ncbi:NAD(P)-dependent oxidoreductase [Deinococcus detaillensis]|uniref:NAD(P)-dependent oxidoreductase n=1 Tax=Deinococcus detaillensis TaxID=2592048 RepID=A0A553V594_9DEIO|nr:NAD(P)-dependent oxidoreductase [Deinococcus detaillensis]TSA87639.1 NAD(P)-dependent oxidoreductase [Deinococcus detaillensis]
MPAQVVPQRPRALLLGAGGFIGQHIAAAVLKAGYELLRGPTSAQLDLSRATPADWQRLLDPAPDIIINAAGHTNGTPNQLFEANLVLIKRLLSALEAQASQPWLVHLGSAAEYGLTPPQVPVSEAAPCRPVGAYGVSKWAATQLLASSFAAGTARGVVLRIFNPLGAGQSAATLPGRAAKLLRGAVQTAPFSTLEFGALGTWRDYVDVRDVARAAVFAAGLPMRLPSDSALTLPVLNVASGQARRSREVVQGLAKVAGFTGQISEQADDSPRSGALNWQQADIRLIQELGWSPLYSFDDALRDLWSGSAPPDSSHPSQDRPVQRAAAHAPREATL